MARIDLYRDSRWVKSLPLAQRVHLIGRDPDAELVLSDTLMPATGMMAPAALQRVQARTRLRTRPHLLRRVKDNNPENFALTLDVTPIGNGSTGVSIGDGKDRILAEVVKSKDGYRVKPKGLLSKMTVNGKATRKALLAVRDRIESDGVILEFHPGIGGGK